MQPRSVAANPATLAGVEEPVLVFRGDRGRLRARHMTTDSETIQIQLGQIFYLDRYAPRRRPPAGNTPSQLRDRP
ncbi:MAG: hypothetical protein MUQ27_02810 [Acidimicrobiia bacterium]|nr:hypothetical protein [Acidimicrobiia bacterium]